MPIQIIVDDSPINSPSMDMMRTCPKCNKSTKTFYHEKVCPRIGTPPPDEKLGKNLTTVAEVREYLSHPANVIDTQLFILKFNGVVPKIAHYHFEDLWQNDTMALCVMYEQRRKKQMNKKDEPERDQI